MRAGCKRSDPDNARSNDDGTHGFLLSYHDTVKKRLRKAKRPLSRAFFAA
jgi:hypothetical protein